MGASLPEGAQYSCTENNECCQRVRPSSLEACGQGRVGAASARAAVAALEWRAAHQPEQHAGNQGGSATTSRHIGPVTQGGSEATGQTAVAASYPSWRGKGSRGARRQRSQGPPCLRGRAWREATAGPGELSHSMASATHAVFWGGGVGAGGATWWVLGLDGSQGECWLTRALCPYAPSNSLRMAGWGWSCLEQGRRRRRRGGQPGWWVLPPAPGRVTAGQAARPAAAGNSVRQCRPPICMRQQDELFAQFTRAHLQAASGGGGASGSSQQPQQQRQPPGDHRVGEELG